MNQKTVIRRGPWAWKGWVSTLLKASPFRAAALLTLVAGCASKPVAYVPVYYDKIPVRSSDAVLGPQLVEAYPIARYQDPQNPDLMHERHVVYRRINRGWRLKSNPGEEIQLGATVGPRGAAYQPNPSRGEVNAAVVSQRYQLSQANRTLRQVQRQLEQLDQVGPTLQGMAADQQVEAQRLKALEDRLNRLEGKPPAPPKGQASPSPKNPNEEFERKALPPVIPPTGQPSP
jgi:hypothetical protein